MGIKDTWQTTPAPDVASVTRELTFGTRPSKKPSFSTRGAVLAPTFCKAKKDYIDQEVRGKSMKQKCLEMVQVTVLFHTDEFIFVWSVKNGNGRQNRSSGAKPAQLFTDYMSVTLLFQFHY